MRQLLYTVVVSNNPALFHLWQKENLVKHQKVSKYYENDCSKYMADKNVVRYVTLKCLIDGGRLQ